MKYIPSILIALLLTPLMSFALTTITVDNDIRKGGGKKVATEIYAGTIASTSLAFVSGSTLPLPIVSEAYDIKEIHCYVESGTSVVINLTDGTNDTETVTCTTAGASDTNITTNSSVTASELMSLEFGTITGAVDYMSFTVYAE